MNASVLEGNICEDSGCLGCYAVLTGKYIKTIVVKKHSAFIFSDTHSNYIQLPGP
jgi:hypothetical protein